MATRFVNCPNCSTQNINVSSHCSNCGSMLPNIGMPMQPMPPPMPHAKPEAEKKTLAGVMGIIFGGLGVHKFILGYQNEGVIMLAVYLGGILLCGIPSLVMSIIGIIEGITYLTKSDEEFVATYVRSKKPWF